MRLAIFNIAIFIAKHLKKLNREKQLKKLIAEVLGQVFVHTWEILPYMAVFKSVHRIVNLGSSMDTFFVLIEL